MPNRSNACGPSSPERAVIAEDLYLRRGAADAAHRCEVNQSRGERDLATSLLAALQLGPGETVVDVCCGSGHHLLRFRNEVGSTGSALGFDFSESAVQAARERGVQAEIADAARLPLADASADALCCSFGVYYLADLRAALSEWKRVLKPGGRLVICGPARGTNAELYSFHEQATGKSASDADLMALGYIDERVQPELRGLGFADVECIDFVNPVHFDDAPAFLDYWESTSLFARTPGATRAAGEAALRTRDEPLRVTKRVTILTARASDASF